MRLAGVSSFGVHLLSCLKDCDTTATESVANVDSVVSAVV